MSLFPFYSVYNDRSEAKVALEKKRNVTMNKKIQILIMAALVAFVAAAMPTEAELREASTDVRAALKTKLDAWKRGDISDGDLAALMFMNADKFKDDARHYACLQAAFAAAVRADDAAFAAKALTRIFMET